MYSNARTKFGREASPYTIPPQHQTTADVCCDDAGATVFVFRLPRTRLASSTVNFASVVKSEEPKPSARSASVVASYMRPQPCQEPLFPQLPFLFRNTT